MKTRLVDAFTRHLQTPFVLLVLAGLVAVLWLSQSFSLGARLFPTVVASLGILLALLELGRQWLRRGAREASDYTDLGDEDDSPPFLAKGLLFFAWMLGFVGLFFLVGALPAAGLFVLGFLKFQFRSPWLPSLGLAAGIVILLWGLGNVLQLRWPAPWLGF
ncbi:tripartite tricarboxylate transporter TctB family protein [Halomonas sp. A29]|uniref:tripartite tricarboxylate transporter TctB family protein n=1 Tax=Halomonas sp. A29 TaxID=3102786 RepID=UPI00398ADCDF